MNSVLSSWKLIHMLFTGAKDFFRVWSIFTSYRPMYFNCFKYKEFPYLSEWTVNLISTQGHYHFCKALSLLGEHELALEANERAQELCKNILDGFKDLIQQNDKLKKTLEEIKGNLFWLHSDCLEKRKSHLLVTFLWKRLIFFSFIKFSIGTKEYKQKPKNLLLEKK